jgi:G:T-mismatch repair DNA endonuclease (very short patch repair protein)
MTKLICPYTKEVISEKNQIGAYIRYTKNKYGISSDELRFNIFKESYGDITSEEKLKDYYLVREYSLPMLLNEFKLPYGTTLFLLKYHGIQARGSKESTKIGASRAKETNLRKYGVDQTFKVKEFDDKRKKTYQEKYGVDNPFTGGVCIRNLDQIYLKKYGVTHKEYKSLKSKQAWEGKTEDEREKWLNDSLLSDKSKCNLLASTGKSVSKPEILIGKLLMEEGFNITSQYKVGRYAFDYKLNDYNILIEFNGDIFHANPEKYLKDDYIPFLKKYVKDIWDRDNKKIKFAKDKNYDTIVIWESEVRNKSEEQIKDIIYDKISKIESQID